MSSSSKRKTEEEGDDLTSKRPNLKSDGAISRPESSTDDERLCLFMMGRCAFHKTHELHEFTYVPTQVEALRDLSVRQIEFCDNDDEDAGDEQHRSALVLTTDGRVKHWNRAEGWITSSTSLIRQTVVQVAAGNDQYAAITSNGDLYTWGTFEYGKLGHSSTTGSIEVPKKVGRLDGIPIQQIVCGTFCMFALSRTGELYSWGRNSAGQTGHGNGTGVQTYPKRVEALDSIAVSHISSCNYHAAASTNNGLLYTWGRGHFLGHGEGADIHEPKLVESMVGKKVAKTSCGFYHTAVITEEGQVYTFGDNEFGQLGLENETYVDKPTLIGSLEGIVISQVSCGPYHTVASTTAGELYSWGCGEDGRLGHGTDESDEFLPRKVDKVKNCRAVRIASFWHYTAVLLDPSTLPPDNVPIATSLRCLVDSKDFSDVEFMVENNSQKVYAHRALLTQRCEYFRSMFRMGMRESHERVVPIPDMRRDIFLLLLEYIYTGTVSVPIDHAIEVHVAAELYGLERLKNICCESVEKDINVENAAHLLRLTAERDLGELKGVCMKYVVKHFKKVSKTKGMKQLTNHVLLHEIMREVADTLKS